jgi:hypothetical protein
VPSKCGESIETGAARRAIHRHGTWEKSQIPALAEFRRARYFRSRQDGASRAAVQREGRELHLEQAAETGAPGPRFGLDALLATTGHDRIQVQRLKKRKLSSATGCRDRGSAVQYHRRSGGRVQIDFRRLSALELAFTFLDIEHFDDAVFGVHQAAARTHRTHQALGRVVVGPIA